MAFKLPNFNFLSTTDTKARVFIIFGTLVAVSVIIFFAVRILSGGPKPVGPSHVAEAPRNLQSTPGGQIQGQYYQALMQLNAQQAQQAQVTGGSAVPTLVNVQQPEASSNCTVLCPGDENANVADNLNDLVRSGKLSQKDADALLDLAKKNVSVDEYAAALDQLVKEGKLTPEQARALLEKYKKQHQNALLKESGGAMDGLIKSGQLPLDAANELLALQKAQVSPSDYAADLNRLVREGKISPTTAQQLLAQYTQQQAREATKASMFGLKQLAKGGAITPDVASQLAGLQAKNASVDDYAAALQRLVDQGKMTPVEAAKLLDQYKQLRAVAGGASAEALKQQIAQLEMQCKKDLALRAQSNKNNTQAPPPESCQKLAALKAELQRLQALQGNNASAGQYADELKRAVEAGLLSPEMASGLLQDYQASTTSGVVPGAETALPSASDFAAIQARIRQQSAQASAPSTDQFAAAALQANVEAEQVRQQCIQQMQAAMSNQVQLLLTSWQAPKMQHVAAPPPPAAEKNVAGGASGAGSSSTSGSATSPQATTGIPLIKAGTILFAVLDTAVDSDYPDTPVMATIVQGDFKGAKLLGKLSLAQSQDKVSLNFNLMNRDDWPKAKTVNAFAIDPDTARTVMASSADYHYFERYGSLFASSFLSGYASGIQSSGSTSTTGVFGSSTSNPALSPGNKLAVGLGQVGTAWSNAIAGYVNTPTTVKVNAGVALGILFMADVTTS